MDMELPLDQSSQTPGEIKKDYQVSINILLRRTDGRNTPGCPTAGTSFAETRSQSKAVNGARRWGRFAGRIIDKPYV